MSLDYYKIETAEPEPVGWVSDTVHHRLSRRWITPQQAKAARLFERACKMAAQSLTPTSGWLLDFVDKSIDPSMAGLRSHSPGEIPPYIAAFTQVSILIRGPSIVTRKSGDIRQRIEGVPGTIGLSPMGLHEDFTHLRCSSGVMPQVAAVIPGASRASRIATDEPIELSAFELLFKELGVKGALTGTAAAGDAALRFSAMSGVAAMIETMPLERAAEAYARMMSGKARFRMVLTMA